MLQSSKAAPPHDILAPHFYLSEVGFAIGRKSDCFVQQHYALLRADHRRLPFTIGTDKHASSYNGERREEITILLCYEFVTFAGGILQLLQINNGDVTPVVGN